MFPLKYYLHSIMYLLIPLLRSSTMRAAAEFTFHNVSINSKSGLILPIFSTNLHSIMYLLILLIVLMFAEAVVFTFHNVSINSL